MGGGVTFLPTCKKNVKMKQPFEWSELKKHQGKNISTPPPGNILVYTPGFEADKVWL